MAYIPTEWKTGDVVTAEKLNKIENYLANLQPGGGLLVTVTQTEDDNKYYYDTDKTAGEILEAESAGKGVTVKLDFTGDPIFVSPEFSYVPNDTTKTLLRGSVTYNYFLFVKSEAEGVTITLACANPTDIMHYEKRKESPSD